MRHLNLVFSAPASRHPPVTPFSLNGSPEICRGCAQPFPLRDGRREAQVGQDGRLYCFNRTLECTLMAVQPAA
jgi:hypothetical protein